MEWGGTLFLYLHIAGVIVAFGPAIAFPILAAKAAKEPMHGNFVLRSTEFITWRGWSSPARCSYFSWAWGSSSRGDTTRSSTCGSGFAIVLFLITLGVSYPPLRAAADHQAEASLTSKPSVPGGRRRATE